MVLVLLIWAPLAAVAWIKVGPIAGLVASVWLGVMFFIASQPGASLWGPGPYSSRDRRRRGTDD